MSDEVMDEIDYEVESVMCACGAAEEAIGTYTATALAWRIGEVSDRAVEDASSQVVERINMLIRRIGELDQVLCVEKRRRRRAGGTAC